MLKTLAVICCASLAFSATAQTFNVADYLPALKKAPEATAEDVPPVSVSDSLLNAYAGSDFDRSLNIRPFRQTVYMPLVFKNFEYYDRADPFPKIYSGDPWMRWLEELNYADQFQGSLMQSFMLAHPSMVPYSISTMPSAPKQYIAKVDPSKHTIEIQEVELADPGKLAVEVKKRHWLRKFNASLQFSQAYVSPNWYQGGNNNLNTLANIYYNVKLNPTYHPKLLFEATMQYKLGLNSAPDDSLRNYAISEDLLQLNATFGVHATKRWYYSLQTQFKTQILNSYVKNTKNLSSAFLSPAEFNAGLGMTYNYVNKKKTFSFDASIAPISYNMKICTASNDKLAHSAFSIDPDKRYRMNFGSTAECKMLWQMAQNISFRSRIFAFTDYSYAQADWENTLMFAINRYLTTQIYCHLRYDTTTPPNDNPSWHKLQVKEILSFGVTYNFSSI